MDARPELRTMDVSHEALREAVLAATQAFWQAGAEIQEIARSTLGILINQKASPNDRSKAARALVDVLFAEDSVSLELTDARDGLMKRHSAYRLISEKLDQRQDAFARRVSETMREQGLTQAQLAEKADVGQSAISMLLSRKSRPQMRTVERIAAALGVAPEQLWPS